MFKSCNNEKGFTMIEVVLTIAMLGVFLASLSHMFAGNNVSAAAFVNVAQATQLAEEKMEEMYGMKSSQGYSAINTTNFSATPEDLTIKGYPNWNRTITIDYALANNLDATSGSDTGLKRVRVTVDWPGGGSRDLVGIFSNWP